MDPVEISEELDLNPHVIRVVSGAVREILGKDCRGIECTVVSTPIHAGMGW